MGIGLSIVAGAVSTIASLSSELTAALTAGAEIFAEIEFEASAAAFTYASDFVQFAKDINPALEFANQIYKGLKRKR